MDCFCHLRNCLRTDRSTGHRGKNTILIVAGVILMSAVIPLPATEAEFTDGPDVVIGQLQSNLIEAMKVGPEILYQGRYDRLDPIVRETHHIPYIARLTIGRHWREISNEERKEFVDRFGKYVVSGYASKFKKFKGEYFKRVSEKDLKRGRKLLVTDLYLDDGDTIRFNYVLSQFEGDWQIINVIVKGISDLALKRAEFTSIIKRDGFATLLDKLAENVDDIRQRAVEEGT